MKRFALAITLILCVVTFHETFAQDHEAFENMEMEDMDSFFEGESEIAPEVDIDDFAAQGPETVEELVTETGDEPKKPTMYIPPPEPTPDFASETEKYVYYARKYLYET